MQVVEQAQVSGKIQYSREEGKIGKAVCDYRFFGASWRCNQKTFWDLTREGNNAQGGLLASHTGPLMEGSCGDNNYFVLVPALGDKFCTSVRDVSLSANLKLLISAKQRSHLFAALLKAGDFF